MDPKIRDEDKYKETSTAESADKDDVQFPKFDQEGAPD